MSKIVLLVEDSRSARMLTKTALEEAGYVVLDAEDGVEGLRVLEKEDVDLVLTDLNMPNMNGLEMCAKIQESERHKGLPIFLLTPLFNQELAFKASQVGVLAWIVKPFEHEKLLEAVRKVVGE